MVVAFTIASARPDEHRRAKRSGVLDRLAGSFATRIASALGLGRLPARYDASVGLRHVWRLARQIREGSVTLQLRGIWSLTPVIRWDRLGEGQRDAEVLARVADCRFRLTAVVEQSD